MAGAILAYMSEINIDGETTLAQNTAQRHGGELFLRVPGISQHFHTLQTKIKLSSLIELRLWHIYDFHGRLLRQWE